MLAPNMEPLTDEQRERVAANVKLVRWWCLKCGLDPDGDSFQDGCFGLMRAAQTFDPDKGFQFSTYATFWIRRFIDQGTREFEGVNYRRLRAQQRQGEYVHPLSLDAEMGREESEESGENGLTLAGVVIAEEDYDDEQAEMLVRAMSVLDDYQREAVTERLRVVAERRGVTRQRVSQVRRKALGRLRREMERLSSAG